MDQLCNNIGIRCDGCISYDGYNNSIILNNDI